MKLALLVPCHNAASYLPALFACVRAQTAPFDEILCYDDASTDDTAAVARSLGARVLRGERNQGAAHARNRLIEACTCDHAHFHDADDLIAPAFVARMSEVLARNPGCPVLCSMGVTRRATGESLAVHRYAALAASADQAAWLIENTAYAIIGVYPLALLQRIGGFNEALRGNEDPDLHVRLAFAGARFAACDEVLVENLVHGASFSSRNWTRCMQDRLLCLKDYEARVHTPAQRRALGREAHRLAYELHKLGRQAECAASIQLAARMGQHGVDSPQLLVRLASRLLGHRLFFSLRARARGAQPNEEARHANPDS